MEDRFSAVVVGAARARVGGAVAVVEARVGVPDRRQVPDFVFLVVIVLARVRIVGVGGAEVDPAVALGRAPREERVVGHV